MNTEEGHSLCSVLAGCRARRGGGGGKRDEGDIGIRDTLADEVLRAVATGTAVAGKSGGTDIGEAEGMLANLNELRIKRHGKNLLVADTLLDDQTITVARESEVDEAVLAARVELVVLKLVGLGRAVEVESTSVGSLDVEAEAVVVGSLRLASEEVGDLPDVVTLGGNWAGCVDLAGLERCGAGNGSGSEERSDGGELHLDGVGLKLG